jgi:hypothetical protein
MRVSPFARASRPAPVAGSRTSVRVARKPLPRAVQERDGDGTAPWRGKLLRRLLVMDVILAITCLAYWRSLAGVSGSDYWYPVSVAAIAIGATLAHLAVTGRRAFLERGRQLHAAETGSSLPEGTVKIALVAAVSVLYVAALAQTGAIAATFVLVIVLGRIAGWRSWLRLCAAGALLSLIAYYVFVRLLLYPIPGLPGFLA